MATKPQRPDMAWLGQLLKEPGRSQTALAQHMGVDKGAVTRIIQGKRAVKIEESAAIEEYLKNTEAPGLRRTPDKALHDLRRIRSTITQEGIFKTDDVISAFQAFAKGDDRKFIFLSAKQLADVLLEEIITKLPNKDPEALKALVFAHLKHPDLYQISALAVLLNVLNPVWLVPCQIIGRFWQDLLKYEEISQDEIMEFYREYLEKDGFSPDADQSAYRAMFGMSVAAIVHDVASGRDGSTATLLRRIGAQIASDEGVA